MKSKNLGKRIFGILVSMILIINMAVPAIAADNTIVVNAAGTGTNLAGMTFNAYAVVEDNEVADGFKPFFAGAETTYTGLSPAPTTVYLTCDETTKELQLSASAPGTTAIEYIKLENPSIIDGDFARSLISNIESKSSEAQLLAKWLSAYVAVKNNPSETISPAATASVASNSTDKSVTLNPTINPDWYYLITVAPGQNTYYPEPQAMLLTAEEGTNTINLKAPASIIKEITDVQNKSGVIFDNNKKSINEIGDKITFRLTVHVPDFSNLDFTSYKSPLDIKRKDYDKLMAGTLDNYIDSPYFIISDTMTNLDLNQGDTKIYIDGYPAPGYTQVFDFTKDSGTDHLFDNVSDTTLKDLRTETKDNFTNYDEYNVFAASSDAGYQFGYMDVDRDGHVAASGTKSSDETNTFYNTWYLVFDLKKMHDYGFDGQTIVIEYTASVNNDAVWKNYNTASVNSYLGGERTTVKDSTESYVYGVEIKKTFIDGDTVAKRQGVSFKLYKEEPGKTYAAAGDQNYDANKTGENKHAIVNKNVYLSLVEFVTNIYYSGDEKEQGEVKENDLNFTVDNNSSGYNQAGQYFIYDSSDNGSSSDTGAYKGNNTKGTELKLNTEDGTLKLYGLEPGATYYLVETAPDGYIPVTVKFTLVADTTSGNYQLRLDDTNGSYAKYCLRIKADDIYDESNAKAITESQGLKVYQDNFAERDLMTVPIQNMKTINLPFTGSDGIWVFALCGVLVIAAGAYCIRLFAKKKN